MHSEILPVAFIKKHHIEITTFHYLTHSDIQHIKT